MNSLPKVSDASLASVDRALSKTHPVVPFPYVVLDGRSDHPDASGQGGTGIRASENERALFVAHVELSAPRWSSAREALVRCLAISQPEPVVAAEQDDAAWDAGAGAAPLVPLAISPVAAASPIIATPAAVESSAIKLRTKRRAPSLNTNPPMAAPAPAPVDTSAPIADPIDPVLPILKEGAAPLVPIPVLGSAGGFAAPSPIETVAVARLSDSPKKSNGRVKKAVGMALLCGLIGMAGFLLVQELMPSGEKAQEQPVVAEAKAVVAPANDGAPEIAPPASAASSTTPESASSAKVTAAVAEVQVAAAPVEPATPSPQFANFVSGLRISGVSLGASPRALINGRMVHMGDVIDPTLAVRLVAVDASSRHLIFEDRSTARVQARY